MNVLLSRCRLHCHMSFKCNWNKWPFLLPLLLLFSTGKGLVFRWASQRHPVHLGICNRSPLRRRLFQSLRKSANQPQGCKSYNYPPPVWISPKSPAKSYLTVGCKIWLVGIIYDRMYFSYWSEKAKVYYLWFKEGGLISGLRNTSTF